MANRILRVVLVSLLLAGMVIAAVSRPDKAGATALRPAAVDDTPEATPALMRDVRGTWLLYQVKDVAQLSGKASAIRTYLAGSDVVGFSLRVPWSALVDSDGRTNTALLDAGRALVPEGKKFTFRFMAGRWTPRAVTEAGPNYSPRAGELVPLPWNRDGSTNTAFMTPYRAFVADLAAYARSHDVKLLHAAWWGQDWAEINHGRAIRNPRANGYTHDAWLNAHYAIVDAVAAVAGDDLAVELPLSGYGPLSTEVVALTQRMVRTGKPWVVQANGWSPTRWFGESGSTPVPSDKANALRIVAPNVAHGVQAIFPNLYDWQEMFDHAARVPGGVAYTEMYLGNFEVAAASTQIGKRLTDLKAAITAFREQNTVPVVRPIFGGNVVFSKSNGDIKADTYSYRFTWAGQAAGRECTVAQASRAVGRSITIRSVSSARPSIRGGVVVNAFDVALSDGRTITMESVPQSGCIPLRPPSS